ncbi:MAG: protein TolR [Caulobacterales bacterium]|nr:protein TolR [Caulobacterales bacterium]MCA0373755.1 protein TolR [Pseudomonadota bacterium]
MAGGLRTRHGKRRRRLMGEINVTPFVDVTLVLLIIFMVAAPLLTVGVPVDLPKTEAKSLPNDQEPISITVLNDGRIFLQKSETQFDNLLPQIQAIAGNSFERRIFIRADGEAAYGKVMQVMARVNAAGYRNLGLVTDPITK